jgi:hypothetical protein
MDERKKGNTQSAYQATDRPMSGRDPRFHSPEKPKRKRKPKKKPLLTRPYVWGPILLTTFVLAYVGFWLYAAKVASLGIAQWVADRRSEGYTVAHDPVTVGGFPLEVKVTVSAPRVTAPKDLKGWSWTADRLVARINPFNPTSFTLDARGHHALALPLGTDGRLVPVSVTADTLGGSVGVDATGGIAEMDLTLKGVTVTGLPGGSGAIGSLTVETNDGPLYGEGDDKYDHVSWSMIARGEGIAMPSGYTLGLSRDLRSLALDLRVLEPIPGGPLHESLKTWRENGGYVSIDTFSVAWAPLAARGTGTLGLDDDLQPAGNFTLGTRGLLDMIEGLGRQGLARSAEAHMARMVLSGMTRDGSLSVPVTLRRRTIHIGPAKLMTVPTIYWGGKGARSLDRIAPGFEIGRDGQVIRDGTVEEGPRPDVLAPIGQNPPQD